MDSGARRDWERQGIPNGRAGRSEPTRAENSADMWNTKLMCTRRAESTRRNIRTNEGWQIWRGYGMERLKSKESNFEMDPSWDWKPVEVFQKGGCAGPWSGECNNYIKYIKIYTNIYKSSTIIIVVQLRYIQADIKTLFFLWAAILDVELRLASYKNI